MAKYESFLKGNFDQILNTIHQEIINGSMSASYEDGSDYRANGVRCAVRVYERYSMLGGNRVSLNVTLLESGGKIFLSGITSGGSQAVFFKLNTVGEEGFLDCLREIAETYRR